MPIAAVPYCTPPAYVAPADVADDHRSGGVFATDAIRSQLSELSVAGLTYPLRRSCHASYLPVAGEFLVEEFSSFVGRGKTLEDARENWMLNVHAVFQDLVCKRPFEMTNEDRKVWSVLSGNIDAAVFRNHTPIQVRQFGRISKVRPFPQEIRWEDGTKDEIRLDQVSTPEFVTFKAGQPLEAVVARDPVDFRLLRIVHVERKAEPTRLPEGEEAELLKSIGSASVLPAAGWE